MDKGNQPQKLTDDVLEKIYLRWNDGESLAKLGKEFDVSATTLTKYKKLLKWDERRGQIQAVVAKRLDKTAATRKSRRARLGAKLQAEGLKKIKGGIENESVAINAIKLGAELEDQAYGESDPDAIITIKIPKGMILGNRPDQLTGDHE